MREILAGFFPILRGFFCVPYADLPGRFASSMREGGGLRVSMVARLHQTTLWTRSMNSVSIAENDDISILFYSL